MGSNSLGLSKNQSFGRFRLDREEEIDSLASRISGEKPELLGVVLEAEGYIVSCLKQNQVPSPAERIMLSDFPITKKEVTDFLYSAADCFSKNQAKKVIMERFNNPEGRACYKSYYATESGGSS